MKTCIILRGCSGSGKTTFCDLIAYPKVVCCADDYFYDTEGNYNWNASEIGNAHSYCRERFDVALDDEIANIILDNTNTKESDWKYYVDEATKAGYRITFVVLENRHGNKDLHNLPEQTLQRQENAIKGNLKLR